MRLVLAVVFGLLIGLGVWFFMRPPPDEVIAPAVAEAPRPKKPHVVAHAMYVSPTSPGLVITVRRDGSVVPRVRVELSRAQRNPLGEIVWLGVGVERTDDDGHVEYPLVTGRYFASALAEDGTRAMQFIDVSLATEPTWATLELQSLTRFAGVIVDAKTKQPVPLAIVTAEPHDATTVVASANSDSLGRVALLLPPSPRWTVSARAQGYVANRLQTESHEFTLELERGVRLEGTVVDSARAPVANATVRLSPSDVPLVTTDDEGHFAVTIRRGPVSLHASSPTGLQALTRFTPRENSEIERVTLVVDDGTSITGVVRDSKGPITGAEIRVLAEPDSLEVASLQTNAEGQFEAKALPKGRYSVHASHGPGRRVNAVGIELPGAAPLELTLPDASTLTGLVNSDDGTPATGALVTLSWTRRLNEVPRTARTDAEGRFAFDGVLAGTAYVRAELGSLKSDEIEAYVAPGGTADVTLTCLTQGKIVGTVEATDVTNVWVRNSNESLSEMASVVDGGFEQTVPAGRYRIFAAVGGHFIEGATTEVLPNQVSYVTVRGVDASLADGMHRELGSGLSFENTPGGVKVDFLMQESPAAKAGLQNGDLIVSIDGAAPRDATDAFTKVKKPVGSTLELQVRRDGRDLQISLK